VLTKSDKKFDEIIMLDLRFSLWWLYNTLQSAEFQRTTSRYIPKHRNLLSNHVIHSASIGG
jgi:hypothetical protein